MTEEIKEILDTPIFIIDNEGFTIYINDIIENYITNLQKENEDLRESNHSWQRKLSNYKSRNEKAIEYIKKDTRWFDSEYAKIYGMLCDCEGAKGDRLEVLVNPINLLNILKGGDEE